MRESVPKAVQDCHELLRWLIPQLDRFPRARRFTLGERLESGMLDVLGELVEASYRRDKAPALRRANRRLQVTRHLWRLSYELEVVPVRRYEHGARLLESLGAQVGGMAQVTGADRVKRLGGLWAKVTEFENLLCAYRKARLGKRTRPAVAKFALDLEGELLALQSELRRGSYRPGAYRLFTIYERKPRTIAAAPFRDRVVHHALMNVVELRIPVKVISDSGLNVISDSGQSDHRSERSDAGVGL